MKNRKAMELSVNFIVILIISIVIFVGGISITSKFFAKSQELRESIDRDTEAQIERLLADGSRVAIPINKKMIKLGGAEIFGLGILNVIPMEKEFYVNIDFSKAFDKENKAIGEGKESLVKDYINSHWILGRERDYRLNPNRHLSVPIKINVMGNMAEGMNTKKGTYIFNVFVCLKSDDVLSPQDCDSKGESYDSQVHKFYVEVV